MQNTIITFVPIFEGCQKEIGGKSYLLELLGKALNYSNRNLG